MLYLAKRWPVGEDTKINFDEWFAHFLRGNRSGMESALRKIVFSLPLESQDRDSAEKSGGLEEFLRILEYAKTNFNGVFPHADWQRHVEFYTMMGWLYETVFGLNPDWSKSGKQSYYQWALQSYWEALTSIDQFMGGVEANIQKWGKIQERHDIVEAGYLSCGGNRNVWSI